MSLIYGSGSLPVIPEDVRPGVVEKLELRTIREGISEVRSV